MMSMMHNHKINQQKYWHFLPNYSLNYNADICPLILNPLKALKNTDGETV